MALLPAGSGSAIVAKTAAPERLQALAEGQLVGLYQIQVKRSGQEFTCPAATAGWWTIIYTQIYQHNSEEIYDKLVSLNFLMVLLLNQGEKATKRSPVAWRVCCNSQAIPAVFKDLIAFDQQTRRDFNMKWRITPQCLKARSSISVDIYSSALFFLFFSFSVTGTHIYFPSHKLSPTKANAFYRCLKKVKSLTNNLSYIKH